MPNNLYNTDTLVQTHHADAPFIEYMISLFIKHMPETSEKLKKSCDESDWQNVRFFAHKMKASIDLFDLQPLKVLIRDVEERARKTTATDTIPKDVNFITSYVDNCINAMKKEFKLN